MKQHIIPLLLLSVILVTGCKKEPKPDTPVTPDTTSTPAYLLSEGSWGGNDAGISLVDLNTGSIVLDWFEAANGRGIGDLAQDLVHYGNRLYATVFTSNTLEVIDPSTGRSIKQIDMGNRGPRYIAPKDGKIYVSCYDKTIVRIDTLSLAIEATCPLSGMQPEQLCVIGNNLYVCNSWQYDANGSSVYDSTISVVNLASFSETSLISVGRNPGRIKAIDDHRFIVSCTGDYGQHPAQTLIVDINSNTQTPLPVAATNFDLYGNTLYYYRTSYDAQYLPTASIYKLDLNTLQPEPILQDFWSSLPYAYSINVQPSTGNLFVCNSPYTSNADLYIFSTEGTLLHKVEGGILSSKVVF